jgi:nucleoside-diphosphate-sugar epimerase
MKKILILGSEGQIGRALKNYLSEKYKVLECDIVNSPLEDLRKKNQKIDKLVKASDFVFFLAFDVGGSKYLNKNQKKFNFIENNILIMHNVFNLIKKYNKKFIFASSTMSNMTHSNYGVLKKIGESYSESLGGITVKFWNVYGIEKEREKSHVITDFIIKGKKYKKINMLTDGKEKRDFLYSEDCCAGLELIMSNYNFYKKEKKIDLTTTKFTSIIEIANIIKKIFFKQGIDIKIIKSKKKDILQFNQQNKANKFFLKYWKPKYSLKEGISEIINFYLK